MPDDGLSSGRLVPLRRWRLSSSVARRAASPVSGMYFAASRPLSLDPSSLRRALRARIIVQPCALVLKVQDQPSSKHGFDTASWMSF